MTFLLMSLQIKKLLTPPFNTRLLESHMVRSRLGFQTSKILTPGPQMCSSRSPSMRTHTSRELRTVTLPYKITKIHLSRIVKDHSLQGQTKGTRL